MLTTVHFLVGAVIGKYINNIWLMIILAILSHYALDIIPHFSPRGPKVCKGHLIEKKYIKKVAIWALEIFFGIALLLFLIYLNKEKTTLMVLGAFFAWFPDLLCFVSWRHNIGFLNKILPRPGNIFYNRTKSLFWGILTNLIIAVAAIILLVPKLVRK